MPAAAQAALTGGEAALRRDSLCECLQPVRPMLADSADDVDDALARRSADAALEYKLDGARIQVHKAGDDRARVLADAQRRHRVACPEIVEAVRALPARELILDGEVIALDADGRRSRFRRRCGGSAGRADVATLRGELPLTLFVVRLLYLDGESLIDEPLERRARACSHDVAPASRCAAHRHGRRRRGAGISRRRARRADTKA